MTPKPEHAEPSPPIGRPFFERVLLPHRSLSPRGFHLLMAVLALISLAIGIGFVSVGAWPVVGFFGLEVALVYLAFRLSYRSARQSKAISVPGKAQQVNCATALACFFQRGVQNGAHAEIGGVRRRNLLYGNTLPISRLIDVAGEFGPRAERAQFDWKALRSTPFSHPPLLRRADLLPVLLTYSWQLTLICWPAQRSRSFRSRSFRASSHEAA
jgi:uncharacterized membrane protein